MPATDIPEPDDAVLHCSARRAAALAAALTAAALVCLTLLAFVELWLFAPAAVLLAFGGALAAAAARTTTGRPDETGPLDLEVVRQLP